MAGFKEGSVQLRKKDSISPADLGHVKVLVNTEKQLYTVDENGVSALIQGSGNSNGEVAISLNDTPSYLENKLVQGTGTILQVINDPTYGEQIKISLDGSGGSAIDWAALTNVPTASTSTSGVLTSASWNIFNNKQAQLTSASNIVVNSVSAISLSGNLIGNSSTSTKLQTPRAISIVGDVSATSQNFDGSYPISFTTTLTNITTAGTYTKGVYNSKGLLTSGGNITSADIPNLPWTKIIVTPTTLTGYGITSADTLFNTKYIQASQLSATFGISYTSATKVFSLTPIGTSGIYSNIVVNSFGQVTSARNITSADIPTHNQAWNTITSVPTATSATSGVITSSDYINFSNHNISTGVVGSAAPEATYGTGTISIASSNVNLYNNPNFSGSINTYHITSATFTLTDGAEEYLVVDYNSGSPIYRIETDKFNINKSDIVLIRICWRQGNTVHSVDSDCQGTALANKIESALINTTPYKKSVDGGLTLGETSTPIARTVTISSAIVYAASTPHNILAFNSNINKLTFTRHVAGVWTYSDVTTYNNTQYDNGTDLVALGNNKYGVVWFYRSIGNDIQAYFVLGDAEYNTIASAQTSKVRSDIPLLLRDHCMLVGRIIIQLNATSGLVENVSDTTFSVATVSNHNDLSNIQGIGPEYYHLSNTQYNELTSVGNTSLHFHSSDRDRNNHTGTQLASTISNFTTSVRSSLSASTPIVYSSATGLITHSNVGIAGTYTKVVIDSFGHTTSGGPLVASDIPTHNQAWSTITSVPTASTSTSGVLTSTNWNTFNNKQDNISPGTTSQYYRGDKTWQTLNTSIVPELTNLYYTQARFDAAFGAKSTSNLTEGTNLYWTQTRFDSAFGLKNTDALAEGTTNLYFTNARSDARITLQKGAALGIAPLDAGAKISTTYLPDAILGAMIYQTVWNASTNTPALPTASASNKGYYWIVNVAGTYNSVAYNVGDWVVSNGASYDKIDNTDSISSWNTRTGAIVPLKGDYSTWFVDLAGSYSNPTWISALDPAKITQTASYRFVSDTEKSTWNSKLSANQTITLSGIVSGSGSTAITTSIADGALSIAKTNGLQSALDGKSNTNHSHVVLNYGGSSYTAATTPSGWPTQGSMYYTGVYGQDYPSTYGNLLSLFGTGANQIFVSWAGSDAGAGTMHFRNKRDDYNGWSAFQRVLDTVTDATSIANWNNAYGWGNHASAGYALSSSLNNYLPIAETSIHAVGYYTELYPTLAIGDGQYGFSSLGGSLNLYSNSGRIDIRSRAGGSDAVYVGQVATREWAATQYQPLDSDLTAIAALTTTAYGRGFLPLADAAVARTYINAQVAGSYLTANQTITLSGIVSGSGSTAITTSIADGALSIAKTNGLQSALDGKQANLGFTPVQQGGGIGQSTNKVYIGLASDSSGLRLQVDSTNFGSNWPIGITGQSGDSSKLGGQLPAYYATASSLSSYLPLAGGTMNTSAQIDGTGLAIYSSNGSVNNIFQYNQLSVGDGVTRSTISNTSIMFTNTTNTYFSADISSNIANSGVYSSIGYMYLRSNGTIHSNDGTVACVTTSTQLSCLNGLTGVIQTQLNGKLSTTGKAADSEKLDGVDGEYFVQGTAASKNQGLRTTFIGDPGNVDTLMPSGFYDGYFNTGMPSAGWWCLARIKHSDPSGGGATMPWGVDFAGNMGSEQYCVRYNNNTNWGTWRTLWHDGNLSSTAVGRLTTSTNNYGINRLYRADGLDQYWVETRWESNFSGHNTWRLRGQNSQGPDTQTGINTVGVDYADLANDTLKFGGQLPAYYATASSLGNYVTLDTNQTITGYKTFNSDVTISTNKALYVQGNSVAHFGGATWVDSAYSIRSNGKMLLNGHLDGTTALFQADTALASGSYTGCALEVKRVNNNNDYHAGIGFQNSGNNAAYLYYSNATSKFRFRRNNPDDLGLWDTSDFTSTNISEWNTAYGWGNHASAGYVTTAIAASTYLPLAGGTILGSIKSTSRSGDGGSYLFAPGTGTLSGISNGTNSPVISRYVYSGFTGFVASNTEFYGMCNDHCSSGGGGELSIVAGTTTGHISFFAGTPTLNVNGAYEAPRVGNWTNAGLSITGTLNVSGAVTGSNLAVSNWNTAYTNSHTHSNLSYLNTVTQNLSPSSSPQFERLTINNPIGALTLGMNDNYLRIEKNSSETEWYFNTEQGPAFYISNHWSGAPSLTNMVGIPKLTVGTLFLANNADIGNIITQTLRFYGANQPALGGGTDFSNATELIYAFNRLSSGPAVVTYKLPKHSTASSIIGQIVSFAQTSTAGYNIRMYAYSGYIIPKSGTPVLYNVGIDLRAGTFISDGTNWYEI